MKARIMEERIITKENVKERTVNILVTIDRNYLVPLGNMLTSYKEVHKNVKTKVYVAHSALEEKNFDYLRERISKSCEDMDSTDVTECEIEIIGIQVKEKWFRDTPVLERLPEESFYRLMAFNYLPKDVSRCLYLDPDIYIQKSLVSLYEMDLEGNYMAGASHVRGYRNLFNRGRLGIRHQKRYINSGVLLMDMDAIRKNYQKVRKTPCFNNGDIRTKNCCINCIGVISYKYEYYI